MKIDFYLRFQTQFGQSLSIKGNVLSLGNATEEEALPMTFLNQDYWHASIEVDPAEVPVLEYQYVFNNENGEVITDGEKSRRIDLTKDALTHLILEDTWNYAGAYENAFYTAPFKEIFLKNKANPKVRKVKPYTHQFKVKAPLLRPTEGICLLGSTSALNSWDITSPILMEQSDDWWWTRVNLIGSESPIAYKYGIYDVKTGAFLRFEDGDNRILHVEHLANSLTVLHDGFVRLPNTVWKGAGVAIPVFSLRSQNSFGVGEFNDLKLLADWSAQVGLKLIQILPINDTSATFSWVDSYPYAAISAFALHPIYINLQRVAGKKYAQVLKPTLKMQKQLNSLPEVDYEKVIHFKLQLLRELYDLQIREYKEEKEYKEFFEENKFWLKPYAVFCYLRDKYNTADFNQWKNHSVYSEKEADKLCSSKNRSAKEIGFHYFIQYHLHLQLKEAVEYAHKKGLAFKGDIPIGIYRYSVDAWTSPELYHMDWQAGAPPDDFAVKGQNWGFPTYNWKHMQQDNFEWWRQRFHQMSNYFDAFRIDHILGFFRIWSIPLEAVEGIMGRFVPALPVTVNEFGERGIWFDYDRFCTPYITDAVLHQVFGEKVQYVIDTFLDKNGGAYILAEAYNTQKKVEDYFSGLEDNDENQRLKIGLFDLISNVLLFEHPNGNQKAFHFRISIENTTSFQHLDEQTKHKLKDLYVDYFYRRQDEFWKIEALHKLPHLKEATEMLICGEDLGMVPHSVPDVMRDLGILSLEIQRMPKDPNIEFFHPRYAPYLSVVTPSTHDMSTLRGWWEENREKTQRFYNTILEMQGDAPYFCESWINRALVLQHLYSPAMWSIFQLQDILGMSDKLRRDDPHEERINQPANPRHYWKYRMHLTLEELIKEKEFNTELKDYVIHSGR